MIKVVVPFGAAIGNLFISSVSSTCTVRPYVAAIVASTEQINPAIEMLAALLPEANKSLCLS
jgi:hypothetical protein